MGRVAALPRRTTKHTPMFPCRVNAVFGHEPHYLLVFLFDAACRQGRGGLDLFLAGFLTICFPPRSGRQGSLSCEACCTQMWHHGCACLALASCRLGERGLAHFASPSLCVVSTHPGKGFGNRAWPATLREGGAVRERGQNGHRVDPERISASFTCVSLWKHVHKRPRRCGRRCSPGAAGNAGTSKLRSGLRRKVAAPFCMFCYRIVQSMP